MSNEQFGRLGLACARFTTDHAYLRSSSITGGMTRDEHDRECVSIIESMSLSLSVSSYISLCLSLSLSVFLTHSHTLSFSVRGERGRGTLAPEMSPVCPWPYERPVLLQTREAQVTHPLPSLVLLRRCRGTLVCTTQGPQAD